MDDTPRIFAVKGNALDDGPGIRTVVFFKGCPLTCAWCHNPEGLRREAEIAFDGGACVGCDTCLGVCTEGALDRGVDGFVDRGRCTLCFDCVDECPSGALERVGDPLDVEALVARVERDRPFYDATGGGVTLGGGEPTMAMGACGELASALRGRGIHVLLQTCGLFDLARFDERVYPHLDLIYLDLKIVDGAEHRRWCGASNDRILDNLAALIGRHRGGGVEVLPRVPLVPGITATDDNLRAAADVLRAAGAPRVSLMPYNPLWGDKLARLGLGAVPDGLPDAFMDADELRRCREVFAGFDLVR